MSDLSPEDRKELNDLMAAADDCLTELEIDAATRKQSVEIAIALARRQEEKIFLSVHGGCLPQNGPAPHPTRTAGWTGSTSTSLINSLMRVSNPAPATNFNPNAACYDQVHVHPKGRFS